MGGHLVTPLKLTPKSTEENTGCLIVLAPVIGVLIAGPMAYLQKIGLEALGFPGWLAWFFLGLSIATALAYTLKGGGIKGNAVTPYLFSYLLAYHGLTVLQTDAR